MYNTIVCLSVKFLIFVFKCRFLYDLNMPLQLKIETIAKEMYGAQSVEFNENVLNKLNTYESKVLIFVIFINLIIS